jgi:hypothetical protein
LGDYKFEGLPLNPTMAMELIVQHLATQQKPVRRVDLTRIVENKHIELGGLAVTNTQSRVMQALKRLVDDKVVSNPALGFYNLITSSQTAKDGVENTVLEEGELIESTAELLTAEMSVGAGMETVYVYFNEAERKLAGFENKKSWPCKVGYTGGSLTTRIISQGLSTSMSKLPSVGLVIKTEDGRGLERILHSALDMAGARIADALGSEWFETSPEKISVWYSQFCEANKSLSI